MKSIFKKCIFFVIIISFFIIGPKVYAVNNGWVKENGQLYYYKNGNKVTGFQDIGGKKYFFSYVTSALKYGWQNLNGNIFYLYGDGSVKDGFQTIDGYTYYVKDNYILKGFHNINEKEYFFSYVTGALKQGIQYIDGRPFYLNKDGSVYRGFKMINNQTYYFGENNFAYQGFHDIGKKRYFFSYVTSTLKQGIQYIDGRPFYLNNDGSVYRGFKTVNNQTFYFGEDNFAYQGFHNIGEKRYFFSYVTSALKYGWQVLNGKRFYLYEDGSVKEGFQKIGGYTYYAKNDYIVKGVKDIDDITYYFDDELGFLVEGFIKRGNSVYFQDKNGFFADGWLEKDSKKYYFNNYKMLNGFQPIGNKIYFFSTVDGRLKTGWQNLNGNLFYLNDDGTVIGDDWQKIGDKLYYFENHYAYCGLKKIGVNYYYFNNERGYLETGWITANNGKKYYSDPNGVLLKGYQIIGNETYYFDENNFQMFTGFMTIDNKKYYFDKDTGKKITSAVKIINGNEYEFASDGELTKIQYIPVYYSQKDPRWAYLSYGIGTFGGNGCAPTSMAMAFQAILERTILPTGIANYLYYQTNEYNKYTVGTSGLGIIKAANYYGVKYVPIKSKNQLDEELKKGRIIFAAMGNGKYATPNWNHAIILHRYYNGQTYSFDPLQGFNNTWVSTDLIWREKSVDPDDSRGGSELYALYG